MTTYIQSAVLMVIYTETEVIEDRILQLGCRGIIIIGYIHVSHRLTRKEFVLP